MAAAHATNAITSTRRLRPRTTAWRRRLVGAASLTALTAFLGWTAVLALTLPSRYLVSHWNVAWVGFDVMLLVSLLTAGWAVAKRRPWAPSALMVAVAMLTCDAWFDVTTASGRTATLVSIGLAVGLELPSALCLTWMATQQPAWPRRSPCASDHRRDADEL